MTDATRAVRARAVDEVAAQRARIDGWIAGIGRTAGVGRASGVGLGAGFGLAGFGLGTGVAQARVRAQARPMVGRSVLDGHVDWRVNPSSSFLRR